MKEEKLLPYELLIRYQGGIPVGAHVQYRKQVFLDGELLVDQVQPPEALVIDDNFPTSQLMTNTAANALARMQQLEVDLAEAHGLLAAQAQAIADATARLAAIKGE